MVQRHGPPDARLRARVGDRTVLRRVRPPRRPGPSRRGHGAHRWPAPSTTPPSPRPSTGSRTADDRWREPRGQRARPDADGGDAPDRAVRRRPGAHRPAAGGGVGQRAVRAPGGPGASSWASGATPPRGTPSSTGASRTSPARIASNLPPELHQPGSARRPHPLGRRHGRRRRGRHRRPRRARAPTAPWPARSWWPPRSRPATWAASPLPSPTPPTPVAPASLIWTTAQGPTTSGHRYAVEQHAPGVRPGAPAAGPAPQPRAGRPRRPRSPA